MRLPNSSRETKFSGENRDRETLFSPAQLTTSRIGNLTRLILTLAICDDHTCIHSVNACYRVAADLVFRCAQSFIWTVLKLDLVLKELVTCLTS